MNGRSIKIHRVPATIAIILLVCFVFYMFGGQEEKPPIATYGLLENENKVNMRKLLIAAIQAAQKGGLEILDVAETRDLKEKSKGKTDEGANDPITDADARSHCVMKKSLRRIFPRITIFSEEDKQICVEANTFDLDPTVLHETAQIPDTLVNADDVTIWIDPLDATQEFTGKLLQCLVV